MHHDVCSLCALSACLYLSRQVLKPGTYEVVPIYTSDVPGTFKWSVGTYNAILQNKAPSITARLPVQVRTVT